MHVCGVAVSFRNRKASMTISLIYSIYVTYSIMIYNKWKPKLITSQPLIKLPSSQRSINSRVL